VTAELNEIAQYMRCDHQLIGSVRHWLMLASSADSKDRIETQWGQKNF
jgi:hypothetical protein